MKIKDQTKFNSNDKLLFYLFSVKPTGVGSFDTSKEAAQAYEDDLTSSAWRDWEYFVLPYEINFEDGWIVKQPGSSQSGHIVKSEKYFSSNHSQSTGVYINNINNGNWYNKGTPEGSEHLLSFWLEVSPTAYADNTFTIPPLPYAPITWLFFQTSTLEIDGVKPANPEYEQYDTAKADGRAGTVVVESQAIGSTSLTIANSTGFDSDGELTIGNLKIKPISGWDRTFTIPKLTTPIPNGTTVSQLSSGASSTLVATLTKYSTSFVSRRYDTLGDLVEQFDSSEIEISCGHEIKMLWKERIKTWTFSATIGHETHVMGVAVKQFHEASGVWMEGTLLEWKTEEGDDSTPERQIITVRSGWDTIFVSNSDLVIYNNKNEKNTTIPHGYFSPPSHTEGGRFKIERYTSIIRKDWVIQNSSRTITAKVTVEKPPHVQNETGRYDINPNNNTNVYGEWLYVDSTWGFLSTGDQLRIIENISLGPSAYANNMFTIPALSETSAAVLTWDNQEVFQPGTGKTGNILIEDDGILIGDTSLPVISGTGFVANEKLQLKITTINIKNKVSNTLTIPWNTRDHNDKWLYGTSRTRSQNKSTHRRQFTERCYLFDNPRRTWIQ